jgi:hypothetical protein
MWKKFSNQENKIVQVICFYLDKNGRAGRAEGKCQLSLSS